MASTPPILRARRPPGVPAAAAARCGGLATQGRPSARLLSVGRAAPPVLQEGMGGGPAMLDGHRLVRSAIGLQLGGHRRAIAGARGMGWEGGHGAPSTSPARRRTSAKVYETGQGGPVP